MTLKNKKVVRTIQIIFGIILIIFGLNGFFQFMGAPQFNEAGMAFLGALFSTGYIFPIMSVIWIISGLLFIINKWSALGAVLIFPFSINLILFHIFLDMASWYIAFVVLILNLYLIYIHWNSYKSMWKN